MNSYKNILVVADVNNVEQSALARAFQIVRDLTEPRSNYFFSIYL